MRAVLAILIVFLLVGCGAARDRTGDAPKPSGAGVLVTAGVLVPVPGPPGLTTPWHQPPSYYALRPDGTVLRKLAVPAMEGDLDFSADGVFAVTYSTLDDRDQIVVSRADGSDRRVVPLPKGAYVTSPSISPDGNDVAVAYSDDPEGVRTDLWKVSIDGSSRKRLATTGAVLSVAWSPDGKRIAFVDGSALEDGSSGAVGDIYVVDADGTDLHHVARGFTGLGREVSWSPDGERIAFQDARQRVAIVDGDGGTPEVVSSEGESPAWSPDGTRIAFLRVRDCGRYVACRRSRILVADLAAGTERVVGPRFGAPISLLWTTADLEAPAPSSKPPVAPSS